MNPKTSNLVRDIAALNKKVQAFKNAHTDLAQPALAELQSIATDSTKLEVDSKAIGN